MDWAVAILVVEEPWRKAEKSISGMTRSSWSTPVEVPLEPSVPFVPFVPFVLSVVAIAAGERAA